MAHTPEDPPPAPKKPAATDKEARRAAALKRNLGRRKASKG